MPRPGASGKNPIGFTLPYRIRGIKSKLVPRGRRGERRTNSGKVRCVRIRRIKSKLARCAVKTRCVAPAARAGSGRGSERATREASGKRETSEKANVFLDIATGGAAGSRTSGSGAMVVREVRGCGILPRRCGRGVDGDAGGRHARWQEKGGGTAAARPDGDERGWDGGPKTGAVPRAPLAVTWRRGGRCGGFCRSGFWGVRGQIRRCGGICRGRSSS